MAGAVAGAFDAAFGTAQGRAIVARTALASANRALHGTLTVGRVGGSLRHGIEATDLTLVGADGVVLARIPRLGVQYRLRDLVSGRIVLGQLRLSRPYVNLVQDTTGRLNLEEVLGLGGPGGGGPDPLIAFHDVVIDSATVCVRTPLSPGDTSVVEREPGPAGELRVRRIEALSARIGYLRLSSPLAREKAIRADIDELRARVSDPALVVRGVRGRVEILGRSLTLDLPRTVLAHSLAGIKGRLWWPGDTLLYDLSAETKNAAVDDIRGLVPGLPAGLQVTAAFRVRSLPGGAVDFGSDRISVAGTHGGGTFSGRLGLVIGPGEAWAARETDLALNDFDLEYVRPILDTLPVAGRLSGRVRADGPRARLALDLDWTFRDSLVPGWPVSRAEGKGVVSIGVPGDFVFRGFGVRHARIDLATVRRILPAVSLQGTLEGAGALSGSWRDVEFSGTIRHADPPLAASVARGVLRMDTRRDTLGVWANLAVDSLRLDGLRSSYPGFRLDGSFAGDVRLAGSVDSLVFAADVSGPAGHLVGGGALVLVSPHYAVRGLDLAFEGLNLARLHSGLPATDLHGRLTGVIEVDTLVAPVARLGLALDTSQVGGSPLDSLRAELASADSLLRVESLIAWAPALRVTARGGLGLGGTRRDSLAFGADVDSVATLAPLARQLLGLAPDTGWGRPTGAFRFRGSVSGSLDDLRVAADVSARQVGWAATLLSRLRLRAEWRSIARGAVALDAGADSLIVGSLHFADVKVRLDGRRDSLGWVAAGRSGENASVAAAGRARADSTGLSVVADSLTLGLPTRRWALGSAAALAIGDSSAALERFTLVSADGGSRLELTGSVPLAGAGALHGSLEAIPLKDLLAALQRDPSEVEGTLSGTFDLGGTARAPTLQSRLALQNAAYGDFRAPLIDGTLGYADHRLQGTMSLRRLGQVVMEVTLDLPIDLALRDAAADRQLPGPLSIRAVADSVDLAFVEALSRSTRNVTGRLSADFGIGGTWASPELTGSAVVTDGAATFPALGVRHEGLNGRFLLHGDTVAVENLELKSGLGTARVTGYLRLARLTRPVLALHVAAQDFRVTDVRNFLTLTATGDVDLAGFALGARVTGRGTVTRGVLYFADLISKQIVNLEDTLYRRLVDTTLIRQQGLGPEFRNRFWDSLSIDSLRLTMGSDVWMRSTEANIQLAGNVVVSKAADRYRLDGTLTTPRGTYRLPLGAAVTREFTVTRGNVQYFGTPDLDAALDIDAQHVVRRRTADNVTVLVHIGGSLYVPRLSLSTDIRPPISDTEIISYLLFGTSSFEAFRTREATSATQLARAYLTQLAGAISGGLESSIIENLGIPLDYVQITPGDATSSWAVELGKQFTVLGAPAFLTVSPRVCSGRQLLSPENFGASLEFRVSREWRVAASIDPVRACGVFGGQTAATSRQPGVDLLWEKSY